MKPKNRRLIRKILKDELRSDYLRRTKNRCGKLSIEFVYYAQEIFCQMGAYAKNYHKNIENSIETLIEKFCIEAINIFLERW
jgi:hypothetical protein